MEQQIKHMDTRFFPDGRRVEFHSVPSGHYTWCEYDDNTPLRSGSRKITPEKPFADYRSEVLETLEEDFRTRRKTKEEIPHQFVPTYSGTCSEPRWEQPEPRHE